MRVLALLLVLAGPAAAQNITSEITRADLAEPTARYDHAILGDALEWGALQLRLADGTRLTIRLPETRVFEDIETRLADLDGDGSREVVVVETDLALGASLAIYDAKGRRAATAFLGQTHRWLAPAGIADFDGDGQAEIAYVDRPHLKRDLVFVRLQGTKLVETARLPGLTNHRIGDSTITSALRDCGTGPEVLLASADWTRLIAATPKGRQDLGPFSLSALKQAQTCR